MENPENLKFRFPFPSERNKTFIHDGQKNKFCFDTFDFHGEICLFGGEAFFLERMYFHLSLCDILQKLENWRGLWQGKPNCQISGSGKYKIKKS